jgi:putative ABC transport system permease protein
MFRNYLSAALRHLARDGLYAAITIIGLAVGFTAAILIALFVRDELSYDQWLPMHERTYLLRAHVEISGREADDVDLSPSWFAPPMKLDFPQVEAIARLTRPEMSVRRGELENNERVHWADPNFFDLLPLTAIAGDLPTALERPDGIVLTRAMARKYFNRDDPVGETLEINREHVMTVTAVLEDLPSNTHLDIDIVGSGRASFSPFTQMDAQPAGGFLINSFTYLRLAPGASPVELERALPEFITRRKLPVESPGFKPTMLITPIADIHMAPGSNFAVSKPRGSLATVMAVAAVGLLIVLIAGINFVNLMTARAARRAGEVGMRKVSGAARSDLVVQFMGEALIYVALGMALALVLAQLLLPGLNAFLDRTIQFAWWSSPSTIAILLAIILGIGVLAGLYPALVLSAFRPAAVLKSGVLNAGGSSVVRRVLVVLQFATLIVLILATGVIYRQTQFALNEGMRLDRDQVYLVRTNCRDAFKDEVAALPGVRATACSSGLALNFGEIVGPVRLPDGTSMTVARHPVDFGFFELFGLSPVAGRFFAREHPGDVITDDPKLPMSAPVVLNETAARRFNLGSPGAAVGKTIMVEGMRETTNPSEIIGIVPDFSVDAIHNEVPPIVYILDPNRSGFLNVKLAGREIPETLAAIDRAWAKTAAVRPINRIFLDQHVQELYRDVQQQGVLFAAFAGVALFIACMGLFGLSAYTAARRTKEIGVRKVMGASSGDIAGLLTWEFVKPVLWANLIAWPVGYYFMNRWLSGFAYHVDLEPWLFAAAAGTALVIAILTVLAQSLLIARTRPVMALRYE